MNTPRKISQKEIEEMAKKKLEEYKKEAETKQKEKMVKLLQKILVEVNYVKDEYEEELRMIAEKEE